MSILDGTAWTGTNLLTNPGFELGNLTGWQQQCATSANCAGPNGNLPGGLFISGTFVGLISVPCQSGSNCFLSRCKNVDYLFQTVNAVVGHKYYVTVNYYLQVGHACNFWINIT